METNSSPVELLFEKATNYSKTAVELFCLKAIDKSADVSSSLLSRLAVLLVVALFVFIISIGFALWIGEILGKTYFGFFVVAGGYAVIAIVLSFFRHKWLKIPISDAIISQIQKQKIV